MSKYDFDANRCKAALNIVRATAETLGKGYSLGEALSDLCLDIEALHTAATERDDLVDAIHDLSPTEIHYTDYVEQSEVEALTDHLWYQDDDRKWHKKRIQPLDL